jgi:glycosyltransferase involved in cell wall biosynthesis
MKILFFNWRDIKNPAGGGAEIYTHEIAKRLVLKGYEVYLITARFPGCKTNEIIDGIKIIRLGNKYTVYLEAKKYYKKHFENLDFVIDGINTRPFMTPKFVGKNTRIIAIIYQLAREFWFYETPFPISWLGYYLLEPSWLKGYIDIPTITVSKSTMQDLLEIGYKYVEIVPIGLNIQALPCISKKEDLPTLIFIGRMGYAKCPDHVLEGFSYIKEELPNAKLWMVGNGAMKRKLEMQRTVDVTFFGHVENLKKFELMSRAHLILVPGLREGWGIVVTEANAMGTPAIGYNIHGLRDSIKNGDTGILCEPTPKAMAEKAIELLKNSSLRKKLSENALRWSREFNWDKSAEKFMEVIENTLK